ncbi:MAG: exodeoxyribonuclease V subunit gamma [Neisseria sp.]|nr:exodeoxyribonuclease V subunit gamma [Neisseria sp.]
MLHLHQSNRLEHLAALLHKIRQVRPLAHPLQPEEILVQSKGMQRFISRYLAEYGGVAANIRFSLPAGFSWRLMRELLPGIPELSPFSTEVMRWRLLGLFHSDGLSDPGLAVAKQALEGYLAGGAVAAYQLAGQLADTFDQYLVYRPLWIDAWRRGSLLDLGEDEDWQAELWRFLDDGRQTAPHRVEMWHELMNALSQKNQALPERLCVFGIATLAPMYLQLLQAVAQHCEVHIFALNPSKEYWGDIVEPVRLLERPDAAPGQTGHPLLASLGKQGRDFFNALNDNQIGLYTETYDPPPTDSLLHRLQHDIQTLSLPDKNAVFDDSIRIVCAHSPMRELQILKDHLLGQLRQHPDWQPDDIAVLTPHIEPYSPFIEAVFGKESRHPLPHSVSDTKISRHQPLLDALEQTLLLFESRFEVDKVLPLLDSEPVLRRFGLTREDLPLLHDTIARLNIHWGLDETMRGHADSLFTWQQGLDRLVLGWMLPDDGRPLWQGISAWHSDPGQTAVLSRLAAFIRTLSEHRAVWQQPAIISEWAARIRGLAGAIFTPGSQDGAAVEQIEQTLALWQQEAELASLHTPLPQEVVIRHLARFLSSQSDNGFLRGGITFCSMVPMRSLPFKAVCLLGLNDGQFPRNIRPANFDLISRHPLKGDRARRDDDRYLFLEALISAREHLYLSYVGRNIHNDEILAPSTLLNELADCLADMTGETVDKIYNEYIEQHPLQPFSARYFNQGRLKSSRQDYAEALNRPIEPRRPFYTHALNQAPLPAHISQQQLLRFWRNPVKSWLQDNLDWQSPYRDEAWDAAEPFEPPRRREAEAAYLEARRSNRPFGDTAALLQAESMLPAGELGLLWQARFENAAKTLNQALLQSPPLAAAAYEYRGGGLILSGSLDHLCQDGQIHFLDHHPNAPEKIGLYLQHLIYNAIRPSGSDDFCSHWIQPDRIHSLPPIPQQQAKEILSGWLEYYPAGQLGPLPFFPRTSLAAAEALIPKKNRKTPDDPEQLRQEAYKKAWEQYMGGKNRAGQAEYAEIKLVFGNDETLPINGDLFWRLVENIMLPTLAACTNGHPQEPTTE